MIMNLFLISEVKILGAQKGLFSVLCEMHSKIYKLVVILT